MRWEEEEEEERQATSISFYGNLHFAHDNKVPALLKHRKMGGVVVLVVVVVVICGFRPHTNVCIHPHFTL